MIIQERPFIIIWIDYWGLNVKAENMKMERMMNERLILLSYFNLMERF